MIEKKKKQKPKPIEYDYYFVTNSKYEDALKEADKMKEDGWQLARWKYRPDTLLFYMIMARPKNYQKP